ncbi:glycosyl hydrolase [uncultured Sphingomonas sp.]|uniref:glycosyl hydrolase n=1 Tax=uncultured Sphingomonas sp. TaxID=158754 RepID=UPI0025CC3572|nr:glycosyl hydrolase [uncultured Sphingomonas sp.]
MLTSVYNAFSVADYLEDQSWTGGRLDAIQLHGGTAGWKDWLSSVQWQADMFAAQDVSIMWSIPLIPYGATLGEAGRGKYDANYLAMAKQLAASSAGDDKIYVRLGWEFNGNNWNSSSAVGDPAGYIAAFRQFVDIARTVSDKFVFEWNVAMDTTDMNPEKAYPGDKYVDVIGVDFYYNTAWHDKDAGRAFDWFVKQPYGLQWQQDFAAAHGKETAVGEWGINTDSPEFVKLAMQWMADHDMVYQNYWESNSAFRGELSKGQYKQAAAEYLTMLDRVATPDAKATITSAVDRALGANEVALTLTGAAIRGSGNARDNVITGNAQDNDLFGGAGNDKLYGGAGHDRLDGGAGADTLVGGTGNDTYIVDNKGDKVIERAGEGIDTVYAKVDYTLTDHVENLYLVTGATKGTGNALDNAIYGTGAGDVLSGLDGDDVLRGYAGDDALFGGNGRDTLYGHEGNDYLDGGAGADVMEGGTGNDTYVVDDAGDVVREYFDSGVDSVYASIDYTLTANVEHLYLTGDARVGTGNNLNNGLNGTAGDDTLYGLGGDDYLRGGAGNDQLYGGTGNDWLYGGAGDDRLDGGSGTDTMQGDGGDDTYIVDNAGDRVIEFAGGGYDTVHTSVNYTLSDHVEALYLTGGARIGTGNAQDNALYGTGGDDTLSGMAGDDVLRGYAGDDKLYGGAGNDTLYGNEGNDYLDGGTGADVMDGGIGNDTYVVDHIGDRVIEYYANGLGGVDTVLSSIDYTLGNNVENLTLTGAAIAATGNALDNVIRGNALNNVITGGAGNDTLYGGGGADRFVFAEGSGKDVIADFGRGDRIDLTDYHFGTAPTVTNVHGGALIDLGGGDSILVAGVTADHLAFTGGSFGFI